MRYLGCLLVLVGACGEVVETEDDANNNPTADAPFADAPIGSPDANVIDAGLTCADVTCDSNATCNDTTGTPVCTCKSGYTGDGMNCADINECDDPAAAGCDTFTTCINNDGGFVCTCTNGLFDENNDGSSCVRPVNSGVCMLRDVSIMNANSPPVGTGYAFYFIQGVNDIPGLRIACTPAIYGSLLLQYCASTTNDVQRGVVTYDATGNWMSTGCDDIGCDYISCP